MFLSHVTLGPFYIMYSHVDPSALLFQWAPFVVQNASVYKGLCIRLLEELATNLNFRFVFVTQLPEVTFSRINHVMLDISPEQPQQTQVVNGYDSSV